MSRKLTNMQHASCIYTPGRDGPCAFPGCRHEMMHKLESLDGVLQLATICIEKELHVHKDIFQAPHRPKFFIKSCHWTYTSLRGYITL
jgi:hypothetical protein